MTHSQSSATNGKIRKIIKVLMIIVTTIFLWALLLFTLTIFAIINPYGILRLS